VTILYLGLDITFGIITRIVKIYLKVGYLNLLKHSIADVSNILLCYFHHDSQLSNRYNFVKICTFKESNVRCNGAIFSCQFSQDLYNSVTEICTVLDL
jgi:hypothetical protein